MGPRPPRRLRRRTSPQPGGARRPPQPCRERPQLPDAHARPGAPAHPRCEAVVGWTGRDCRQPGPEDWRARCRRCRLAASGCCRLQPPCVISTLPLCPQHFPIAVPPRTAPELFVSLTQSACLKTAEDALRCTGSKGAAVRRLGWRLGGPASTLVLFPWPSLRPCSARTAAALVPEPPASLRFTICPALPPAPLQTAPRLRSSASTRWLSRWWSSRPCPACAARCCR